MRGKRQFGSIRGLRSGRWQSAYWCEGARHVAPMTFRAKADASAWLAGIEDSLARGAWVDPRAGGVTFASYAARWLDERHELRISTREDYERQLAVHLLPAFGERTLTSITTASVRSWYVRFAARSPGRAAKCYRLLRAILATAEVDRAIDHNPCRIRGAGTERVVERVIPTVPEAERLADAMPERLRMLVTIATWCGLRRGELLGLRRQDVDLLVGAVRVERSAFQKRNGTFVYGPPKTAAGRRTVRWPPNLRDDVEEHLRRFVAPEPAASVFTGEKGGPLRPHVLQAAWQKACTEVGVPTGCTTSGTSVRRSQPRLERARRRSWGASDTRALPRHCAISTRRKTATRPSPKRLPS